MRKLSLLLLAFAWTVITVAQDKEKEEGCKMKCCQKPKEKKADKHGWTAGGGFMLLGSQAASKNWAPGAERSSLAANAGLKLWATQQRGRNTWSTILTAHYGLIRTNSGGFRKNDDEVDLYTKFVRKCKKSKVVSYGVIGDFRSQFTNGYNYDFDPGYNLPFSGWMAPGYLTIAPGFQFTQKTKTNWQIFLSPIAYRSVIVANKPYTIRNNMALANGSGVADPQTGYVSAAFNKSNEFARTLPYGVNPQQKVRHEVGPYLNLNYQRKVMSNIHYSCRLDLFSNLINSDVFDGVPLTFGERLRSGKPGNVDVYWTNTVTMRVNKLINVVYSFNLVYDDNTRNFSWSYDKSGTQVRSSLGVGIAAHF
jgi:hypothetical protein